MHNRYEAEVDETVERLSAEGPGIEKLPVASARAVIRRISYRGGRGLCLLALSAAALGGCVQDRDVRIVNGTNAQIRVIQVFTTDAGREATRLVGDVPGRSTRDIPHALMPVARYRFVCYGAGGRIAHRASIPEPTRSPRVVELVVPPDAKQGG